MNVDFAGAKIAAALNSAAAAEAPAKDKLEVVFHRDYKMDDGRWNNNGWLQELPDPITKTVWDGLVLVSRLTAEEYGQMPDDGPPTELVLGRRVELPPPNRRHGQICMNVAFLLGSFVRELELGHVVTSGKPAQVIKHPEVVASYLGTEKEVIARSGRPKRRTPAPTPEPEEILA